MNIPQFNPATTFPSRKECIPIIGRQRIGNKPELIHQLGNDRLPARSGEDEASGRIVGTGFDFALPWLQAIPHAESRSENAAPADGSLTFWRDFHIW
jgi:hypothetical protein